MMFQLRLPTSLVVRQQRHHPPRTDSHTNCIADAYCDSVSASAQPLDAVARANWRERRSCWVHYYWKRIQTNPDPGPWTIAWRGWSSQRIGQSIADADGGNGAVTLSNNDWKDTQEKEIMATGIPPSDDLESAILATLPPGSYTAVIKGEQEGTGAGLVELYD